MQTEDKSTTESGDIAPIINKAKIVESLTVSPDSVEGWEKEFERMLALHTPYKELESFISQEIEKAREEGRQEAWSAENLNRYDRERTPQIRQEERERILKLIEEMKKSVTNGMYFAEVEAISWNQALEAIKEKI